MEYFQGESVDEHVNSSGNFNESQVKIILRQLCSAILTLHDLNICHRDVKPENILVNSELEIKLIDFNISKVYNHNSELKVASEKFKSVYYTQINSPLYSAPELHSGAGYTESIDIWGIGIVMFTCLFGSMASFSLNRYAQISERQQEMLNILDKDDLLSNNCKDLLKSLLSLEPDQRP